MGHQNLDKAVLLAADRARSARADNTLRAYRSDCADYEAWCTGVGLTAEPNAPTVAVYLDQLARAGAKVSTIRRRIAALNARLRANGGAAMSVREDPLASVLRGIRREIGEAPRQAKPVELDLLRTIAVACGDDLQGLRDRALILAGFAGAFRRSELAGLSWSAGDALGSGWVEYVPEGLRVRLRRSKTNQTGQFEEVAICRGAYATTCPVRALEDWEQAVSASGAESRSPQ